MQERKELSTSPPKESGRMAPCSLCRLPGLPHARITRGWRAQSRATPPNTLHLSCQVRNACHDPLPSSVGQPVIGLFWDMDNIRPKSIQQALMAICRFRRAVRLLVGDRPLPPDTPQLVAYANEATVARLERGQPSGALSAALQLAQGHLVTVKTRRQAADLAMRSALYQFVEQHKGDAACLVCISTDQGYAPSMRFAAGQSCYAVCIGSPHFRGPTWAKPHFEYGKRYPLSAACHVTLLWSFVGGTPSLLSSMEAAAEAQLLADWQAVAGEFRSLGHAGQPVAWRALQGKQQGEQHAVPPGPEKTTGRREGTVPGHMGHSQRQGQWDQQQWSGKFGGRVIGTWVNPKLAQPAWLPDGGPARLQTHLIAQP